MRTSNEEERDTAMEKAPVTPPEPSVSRSILISGPESNAAPKSEDDVTTIRPSEKSVFSVRPESDPAPYAAWAAYEPGPESVWAKADDDHGVEDGAGGQRAGNWNETLPVPARTSVPTPPPVEPWPELSPRSAIADSPALRPRASMGSDSVFDRLASSDATTSLGSLVADPAQRPGAEPPPGRSLLLDTTESKQVALAPQRVPAHREHPPQGSFARHVVLFTVCFILIVAGAVVVSPDGFRLSSGGESAEGDLEAGTGSTDQQADNLDVRAISSTEASRRLGAGGSADGVASSETSQEPTSSSTTSTEAPTSSSTTSTTATSTTAAPTSATSETTTPTLPSSSTETTTSTSTPTTSETTTPTAPSSSTSSTDTTSPSSTSSSSSSSTTESTTTTT